MFSIISKIIIIVEHFFYNIFIFSLECCFLLRYPFLLKVRLLLNSFYFSHKEINPDDQSDFIYGETPMFTMAQMLSIAKVKDNQHFYDLGCGKGNNLFVAYCLNKLKPKGIEQNSSLLNVGKSIAKVLNVNSMSFSVNDFLNEDLSAADIIYIAGTSFEDETINNLSKKSETELKKGSIVITLSYPLQSSIFNVFLKKKMFLSWGRTMVYFQKKRS